MGTYTRRRGIRAAVAALVSLVLVGALVVGGGSGASAGTGRNLSVPFKRQNTPVWCWAASIAMVVEFLDGTPIQDCEVLSKYDRSLGGPGQCCAGAPACNRASVPGEIGAILGTVFGLHGEQLDRSLSWAEVVETIDRGSPIIAWIWSSPQTAHVVVISGYSDSGSLRELRVLDPLQGMLTVAFDAFSTNWDPKHNWNMSWTFNTSTKPASSESKRQCVQPCTHAAHPQDEIACVHPMHAFDTMPCQHCMMGPFGIQCVHPFDSMPCSHPAHAFDAVPCRHRAHLQGDIVECPED